MSWEDILKNAVVTTANAQMQVDDDYSDLEEEYREDCKEQFLRFGTKLNEMHNALSRMIETHTYHTEMKIGKPRLDDSREDYFDGDIGIIEMDFDLEYTDEDVASNMMENELRFTRFEILLDIEHNFDLPDEVYCKAIEMLKQAEFKGVLSTIFNNHHTESMEIGGRRYRIVLDKYLEGNDGGDLVNSMVGFNIGVSSDDPNTSANEIRFDASAQRHFTFTKEQGEQMYNKVMQIWGV